MYQKRSHAAEYEAIRKLHVRSEAACTTRPGRGGGDQDPAAALHPSTREETLVGIVKREVRRRRLKLGSRRRRLTPAQKEVARHLVEAKPRRRRPDPTAGARPCKLRYAEPPPRTPARPPASNADRRASGRRGPGSCTAAWRTPAQTMHQPSGQPSQPGGANPHQTPRRRNTDGCSGMAHTWTTFRTGRQAYRHPQRPPGPRDRRSGRRVPNLIEVASGGNNGIHKNTERRPPGHAPAGGGPPWHNPKNNTSRAAYFYIATPMTRARTQAAGAGRGAPPGQGAMGTRRVAPNRARVNAKVITYGVRDRVPGRP
jgi:hypothetical protein